MTLHKRQQGPEILISPGQGLIVCTGGGGKTSLIRCLASYFQSQSFRVIITTTTKIFPFPGEPTILQTDGPDFMGRIHHGVGEFPCITLARTFDPVSGKLIGLDKETITLLHQAGVADMILVEADGAARKPLKAPEEHEPVIPEGTELCIAVMGLDGAYQPLGEATVHRHEIFSSLTGLIVGETITPAHMIQVALAQKGLFKGCAAECEQLVLLNKMDIPGGEELIDEFQSILDIEGQPTHIEWFAGSMEKQYVQQIERCGNTPRTDSSSHRMILKGI
jgi:probable selenium-dependent hydroxylase accessory protein YqeC